MGGRGNGHTCVPLGKVLSERCSSLLFVVRRVMQLEKGRIVGMFVEEMMAPADKEGCPFCIVRNVGERVEYF